MFKKYQGYNKNAFISFVSNSSTTRKACVDKGQGVSILPEFMIREDLKNHRFVKLYKPEKFGLYLIERQSSYRNTTKKMFINAIKDAIQINTE